MSKFMLLTSLAEARSLSPEPVGRVQSLELCTEKKGD